MILWDFDENKNYITIGNYKVLNLKNAEKASKLLDEINRLIIKSLISIKLYEQKTPEISLLLKTPYILQEMQLIKDQGSIKFEGLNKPKKVSNSGKINIGADGKLRAEYRKIFLTIRKDNGEINNITNLIKLIAHELTHTALNHVTWKDDNHGKKFNKYYKVILRHILLNYHNVYNKNSKR